ncbi:MAG TPA: restriction endonuclease [Solirubrobacterales bacterium]|nr:restriction endonuclease [Solirubrobacterales bacterium]
MGELDRKRRGELLRAVFDVLAEHPDGIQARDALAGVESRIGLTEFEAANYPGSGTRRFEKTVRFQTINAVKAGWMVKEAGVWTPTDEGLAAHRSYADPEQFMEEAEKLYRVWAKAQPAKEAAPDSDAELSDASLTLEEAEETAWKEVREFLHAMDPYDFQRLVAGLLRGMGYEVTWVAPPGKDGGVDIVALGDPVGTKGPRVKVQVKREKRKTDVQTVRAFASVLREGDVGFFVTLGGFTTDSEAEVRNEARRIRLVGAFQLFELWTKYYDRIPQEDRRRLPIKLVPFLVPPNKSNA